MKITGNIPILSTKKELQDFIKETLENRNNEYKIIKIGETTEDAKQRIEKICGKKISSIDIDNSGVIHAVSKVNHNIESDDLLLAVDVINTTTDISLSDKKHQDCDVLIFKKDIDGEITFLTETHIKKDYLLIFNAWRQNKARRNPNVT